MTLFMQHAVLPSTWCQHYSFCLLQDYAATESLGVQANKSTPNTFLTEQCQKAVEMLSKMTTPSGQGGAKTYDLIPRASVRACLVRATLSWMISGRVKAVVAAMLTPSSTAALRITLRSKVKSASLLLQGIQFFDLKLVGAGISLTRGLGFTIRKLGKLNGVSCLHSSQMLCQMNISQLHELTGHAACLRQP